VTVVLGLAAALLYGIGDFGGGIAARGVQRANSAITVLLHSYPVGVLLMAALLPVFPGTLNARVLLFGTLGGLAGLVGVSVMYQLMVTAPMNVISPVTAVLATIVPVVVGVGIGERPAVAAWFGIVLGIGAVVLVSRTSEDHPHGRVGLRVLALAGVSGLGFGLYFVFLARAGHDSGLWPLLVSRVASAIAIVPIAARLHGVARIADRRVLAIALVSGACDALANMCFLLASRAGLLSLASVLTSLYPATTVLLAVVVLKERTNRVQRVGLALAAAAVVLITV
jgi:drug/metabolite transporter (DMT)-like permease